MIAALLAATLAAGPAAPPPPAAEPRRPVEPFVAAGPWLGRFHGLDLRGLSARAGLRLAPRALGGAARAPLRFELAVELARTRTPAGLALTDAAASGSVELATGPLRWAIGLEAVHLWHERATLGRHEGTWVRGLRAAGALELPLGGGRRAARIELALRSAAEGYHRAALLAGLRL